MKFGGLKAGDYFTYKGELYKKVHRGMSSKKAVHIKTDNIVDILLMSEVVIAGPPPKKYQRPKNTPPASKSNKEAKDDKQEDISTKDDKKDKDVLSDE